MRPRIFLAAFLYYAPMTFGGALGGLALSQLLFRMPTRLVCIFALFFAAWTLVMTLIMAAHLAMRVYLAGR